MKLINILDVVKIANRSVDRFSGVKRYIATGDLSENIINSYTEVTYDNRPSRANVEVKTGQVIFARMKDTKKVLLIDDDNVDFIYSTGFCVFEPSKAILSDYLRLILNSDLFQNQKDKYSKGATQKAINNAGLKKIQIPLPSLETQKKIVEVLDKAQGLIDARKEQITLMDELIQSVFYEMFGDPVTNPKGWEVSKLKNHLNNIESGWSPKCLNNDTPINRWGVLKLSAVTGGQYKAEHNKELPEDISPRAGLEIKDGDLLLTRKNTPELVGDSCFVFKTREKLMMPDIIFRIQTKQTLNRLFLWAVFNTSGMKSRIKSLASGSAKSMSNISKAKLYDMEVIVPSIDLQNHFEIRVRKVVDHKELLLRSLFELETYNKTLFKESYESEFFGG